MRALNARRPNLDSARVSGVVVLYIIVEVGEGFTGRSEDNLIDKWGGSGVLPF